MSKLDVNRMVFYAAVIIMMLLAMTANYRLQVGRDWIIFERNEMAEKPQRAQQAMSGNKVQSQSTKAFDTPS